MLAVGIESFAASHQFAEHTSQMWWFCWDSESYSGSHGQQTNKQWPWYFFGTSLALGSALELLSPTTELVIASGCIKSTFCCMALSDQEMVHCCCKKRHFKMTVFFWFAISSCCSLIQLCITLCDPVDCTTPGFPVLHYLPEFNFSPSNKYSGLISFRIDWFDLAVQGTLKNLLQHHSSKTSILRCSAFFIIQLSHPYITTGKTIALTFTDLCFLICCLGLSHLFLQGASIF